MISYVDNTCRKPNFTSNLRRVYDASTNSLLYLNTTGLFRKDLDWDKFADFLISKYKNTDKVNIYCYACSDGSEPYSLAIKLIEKAAKLGVDCDKFFPIYAKDIDSKMISMAKRGYLPANESDEKILTEYPQYFEKTHIIPDLDLGCDSIWRVRSYLKNKVIFQHADINTDINIVKPNNSVVMARNFWIYLDGDFQRRNLARNIQALLKKNSLLVVGNSENIRQCDVVSTLSDFGYTKTPVNNVFDVPERKIKYKSIYY